MFTLSVCVYTVALLATLDITECDVVPAGLCKPQEISILPIDYEEYLKIRCWNIMFVTESEVFRDVDHSFLEFTSNGDGSYTLDATRVLNDTSSSTQTYRDWYENNIVAEEGIDYNTGIFHHYEIYPLAVTPNFACLYVRCSKKYVISEDTRYIAIPDGHTLTDKDVDELLKVDSKYNFHGNLTRLPYKLYGN